MKRILSVSAMSFVFGATAFAQSAPSVSIANNSGPIVVMQGSSAQTTPIKQNTNYQNGFAVAGTTVDRRVDNGVTSVPVSKYIPPTKYSNDESVATIPQQVPTWAAQSTAASAPAPAYNTAYAASSATASANEQFPRFQRASRTASTKINSDRDPVKFDVSFDVVDSTQKTTRLHLDKNSTSKDYANLATSGYASEVNRLGQWVEEQSRRVQSLMQSYTDLRNDGDKAIKTKVTIVQGKPGRAVVETAIYDVSSPKKTEFKIQNVFDLSMLDSQLEGNYALTEGVSDVVAKYKAANRVQDLISRLSPKNQETDSTSATNIAASSQRKDTVTMYGPNSAIEDVMFKKSISK